ncbi:MAG: hypothetical protein ACE5G7_03990 [Candidatus Hydrothermarchaeaceae archaeon]
MLDGELLRTRVDSKAIGDELLIYGSCIMDEFPGLLSDHAATPKLRVCMEEYHINKVAWKIQSIARVKGLKRITVLTVDGSPHCIQLHYAVDDVGKVFPELELLHEVVAQGEKKRIKRGTVRRSRHLSELQS